MSDAGGDSLARLARAYTLAARAHAGQRRKGPGDVPYLNHPCDVAALVATLAEDPGPDAVIAAVLHDVVEDSPTTLAEIDAAFGPGVAALVDWVTDAPDLARLPMAERKAAQARHMAGAPPGAKAVKIADQTSNLRDLARSGAAWPAARCRAYVEGARRVVDACRGPHPRLEAAFDEAARLADAWAAGRATAPREETDA
ncbi:MAG: HD domain-containing protein [Pseudomonadota bacterium]